LCSTVGSENEGKGETSRPEGGIVLERSMKHSSNLRPGDGNKNPYSQTQGTGEGRRARLNFGSSLFRWECSLTPRHSCNPKTEKEAGKTSGKYLKKNCNRKKIHCERSSCGGSTASAFQLPSSSPKKGRPQKVPRGGGRFEVRKIYRTKGGR